MSIKFNEVRVVGDVDSIIKYYEYQNVHYANDAIVIQKSLSQREAFNLVKHKYDKLNSDSKHAALILAIKKFGKNGCNAKQAHHAAFGNDVPYVSNNHPFADLGLFVEEVPGDCSYANTAKFAAVDPTNVWNGCCADGSKMNYAYEPIERQSSVLVTRISRAAKYKYRLSDVGLEVANSIEFNARFFKVNNIMKEMMSDKLGVAHYLIEQELNVNSIDIGNLLKDVEDMLENADYANKFGNRLKTYCKVLKKLNAAMNVMHAMTA